MYLKPFKKSYPVKLPNGKIVDAQKLCDYLNFLGNDFAGGLKFDTDLLVQEFEKEDSFLNGCFSENIDSKPLIEVQCTKEQWAEMKSSDRFKFEQLENVLESIKYGIKRIPELNQLENQYLGRGLKVLPESESELERIYKKQQDIDYMAKLERQVKEKVKCYFPGLSDSHIADIVSSEITHVPWWCASDCGEDVEPYFDIEAWCDRFGDESARQEYIIKYLD